MWSPTPYPRGGDFTYNCWSCCWLIKFNQLFFLQAYSSTSEKARWPCLHDAMQTQPQDPLRLYINWVSLNCHSTVRKMSIPLCPIFPPSLVAVVNGGVRIRRPQLVNHIGSFHGEVWDNSATGSGVPQGLEAIKLCPCVDGIHYYHPVSWFNRSLSELWERTP